MRKSTIILSVVTVLSIAWGVYSDMNARKVIQEREDLLVEVSAHTVSKTSTDKSAYELWQEDDKKEKDKQEKQKLIFELENLKKELENKNFPTIIIDETIKELSKDIHDTK